MPISQERNLFYDLYLKQIHLWAREHGLTGKNVKVAVVDTGIISETEYLKDTIIPIPGTTDIRLNTTEEGSTYVGTHGTEMACLIHIIAPDAKIYDVKALSVTGRTLDQHILSAIGRCISEIHPDIMNLSLGVHRDLGCDGYCMVDRIVNLAADSGIITVASAGNRGASGPIACPGNAEGALTVGGVTYKEDGGTQKLDVADFSSWSTDPNKGKPDIVAPSDIPVRVRYHLLLPSVRPLEITIDEPHKGTSYSSPFASGVMALLLERKNESNDPRRFPGDARAALVASADVIPDIPKEAQGNGLLNLPKAASVLGLT
jgi:serine protease AprX